VPEAGNVVRLPREWLGPPEELVPFGPSARAREAERVDSDPQGADRPVPDFWGEGSAVLQDAIEVPAEALAADDAKPEPTTRRRAKARPRRWQTALSPPHRRTRVVAVAALVLCAIAGTVIIAPEGPRPAARVGTSSSSADPFAGSLLRAVAVAQATLTRAETNVTRATRRLAAERPHPPHEQGPAVSRPATAADSAPAVAGNGTSQTAGGGSSPPPTRSATPTQSQHSPPAEPAQPAASTNEPAHPSPLGGLACGC
jgi:hypothetical protein